MSASGVKPEQARRCLRAAPPRLDEVEQVAVDQGHDQLVAQGLAAHGLRENTNEMIDPGGIIHAAKTIRANHTAYFTVPPLKSMC